MLELNFYLLLLYLLINYFVCFDLDTTFSCYRKNIMIEKHYQIFTRICMVGGVWGEVQLLLPRTRTAPPLARN